MEGVITYCYDWTLCSLCVACTSECGFIWSKFWDDVAKSRLPGFYNQIWGSLQGYQRFFHYAALKSMTDDVGVTFVSFESRELPASGLSPHPSLVVSSCGHGTTGQRCASAGHTDPVARQQQWKITVHVCACPHVCTHCSPRVCVCVWGC